MFSGSSSDNPRARVESRTVCQNTHTRRPVVFSQFAGVPTSGCILALSCFRSLFAWRCVLEAFVCKRGVHLVVGFGVPARRTTSGMLLSDICTRSGMPAYRRSSLYSRPIYQYVLVAAHRLNFREERRVLG